MNAIHRHDVRHIALIPLVAMLTAGIVSALAGLILFFSLGALHGDTCVQIDAAVIAAIVSLVSGIFTATCALAHLPRHAPGAPPHKD